MKKIDKNSKVGFIIHTYGPIDPNIYFNHMGCMMSWANKYNMAFIGIDKQRVADSRNMLIQSAKSLKCTHVIIIDSDHMIPDHALNCLSKNNDAMIVSGLITKRKPPYHQVGFVGEGDNYHPIDIPIDGRSYLVDVPAMGCTLIDMDVFNIIEEPYFFDTTEVSSEGKSYNKRSDINFFEKCGKAGIKMIVDSRVLVGHLRDPEPIYPNCIPNVSELNRENKIWGSFDSVKYQDKVYETAKLYAIEHDFRSVLDLGCGNPVKLYNKLGFVDNVTGIDFSEKILDIAAEGNKYNNLNAKWLGHDLDNDLNLSKVFNLVISADVIEHLKDPDTLIKTAKNHMNEDSIFIVSSPEKRTTRQDNPLHVKEFTSEELLGILLANGLSITEKLSYQEIVGVPYTNNVFVCKLNKEFNNGNCNSSKK